MASLKDHLVLTSYTRNADCRIRFHTYFWNLYHFQIYKLANSESISEVKKISFLCTGDIIKIDTSIPHTKWESSQ